MPFPETKVLRQSLAMLGASTLALLESDDETENEKHKVTPTDDEPPMCHVPVPVCHEPVLERRISQRPPLSSWPVVLSQYFSVCLEPLEQTRALRIVTACSGTNAPVFGVEASFIRKQRRRC